MPGDAILTLYRDMARAGSKMVVESWKRDHDGPMAAARLRETIDGCLLFPQRVREACQGEWDRLTRATDYADFQESGVRLRRLFEDAVDYLEAILEAARIHEQDGYPSERIPQLERALASLRAMREEFEESWPWFGEADRDAARADQQRGDLLDVDDAFAGIAGVDRETWLRRVEERKRKKQP
jgi:hypothetical protein